MPNISIFRNVKDVYNPDNIELVQYLEDTRNGRWQDIVTQCRLIKDDKERKAFKETMPTATLSGLFSVRRDNSIIEHSSFISMDLDDIEDTDKIKDLLINDKYVYSCFISTSGFGLRVLFKINPKKHRESFLGISKYLLDTYDIMCDPNGINTSKPYLVSFDPYLYISDDDVPIFTNYPKETFIKKIPDFVHTAGDFEEIYKNVIGRNINICEEYSDWLKVCFALAEQFGEAGRAYFHGVSSCSPKYKWERTDKQFSYCLKAKGSGVNISSFYYLCKIHGVAIVSEQTKTIVRATKNGKKAGLSKEQIIENLVKFSNIANSQDVVSKVFDSKDDDEEEEDSIIDQLEMYLANNYSLRMNEVSGYIENGKKRLSPNDLNTIFIGAKKMFGKLDYQLMMRLLKSDFVPSYNPFFEFFGSDGIPVELPPIPIEKTEKIESPLIDKLAECIENNDPAYTKYFLRKWIISIVSAAHKVHSPLLLCLLGEKQGTGKTEFFRRLLPKELSDYYAESKLDKEKDDEILMTQKLIIMDDELSGKSKQDNLKLKNITSKQYFSLRRPYGDQNEDLMRLAVLCGTSNQLEILSDTTGNRRIIPIEVININKQLYNSIDKSELFMEAFKLYKKKVDWRITGEDIVYLNNDQEKYETLSIERELIQKYFDKGSTPLSASEIKVEIEQLTHQKLNIKTIGMELSKLSFTRKSVRIKDQSMKKWMVCRINRNNGEFNPEGEIVQDF